jgi:hypothetical protein
VLANGYAKTISLRVQSFQIHETDSLQVGPHTGPLTPHTGEKGAGTWIPIVTNSSTSLQQTPGYLLFTSGDDGSKRDGFQLDQAKVSCSSPGHHSPWNLAANPQQRHTGVLLDSEDTVHFFMPANPSYHFTLAMWADTTAGNDFDLYLRCNARPSEFSYTQRSSSGNASNGHTEFLHVDSYCSTNWFVAVHSASGSGWFNLVYAPHYANQHIPTMYAGTYFDGVRPNEADLANYRAMLATAARRFFGATAGVPHLRLTA